MTRTLCTLAALLISATSFAQDTAWAVEDVASSRFADADVEGPKVAEGARLTVLVREADRVRVAVGTDYGWIPLASISDEKPLIESSAPPMTLDSAALEQLLKQTQGLSGGLVSGPPSRP